MTIRDTTQDMCPLAPHHFLVKGHLQAIVVWLMYKVELHYKQANEV